MKFCLNLGSRFDIRFKIGKLHLDGSIPFDEFYKQQEQPQLKFRAKEKENPKKQKMLQNLHCHQRAYIYTQKHNNERMYVFAV